MKLFFTTFFALYHLLSVAQTDEEKKFLDTLKMGGSYLIGTPLRSFEINSSDGKLFNTKNLKGKVTFINFWFEGCVPCLAEMNALEILYTKYSQNNKFQFLSFTYENKEIIDRVSKKYNLTFPILSTSEDYCSFLNFGKGYPTNIIVDGVGKIALFSSGGTQDNAEAEVYLKSYYYPLLNCMLHCK